MVWEVLDIIGEADNADEQLDQWVHKKSQVTDLRVCQGQNPQLEAVVELPAVDAL